ncbi:MAG: twin-arginine translocase TatA/TatE family subunit [Methylococcaceae bacterium]|jgi:sec-independent protein translocase protein TatA|nr:twin-arginine translocase TatA/TatE family subunit [Methylococcaceae bacterium]
MGIGVWELVLLFLIVLVLFGTKRLRNIGGDLGSAIKGFRSAMNDPDTGKDEKTSEPDPAKAEAKVEDNKEKAG